jgi:hypothetical protein
LVLALDPTLFEDRFTVLAISVLYRSCAVPVMWTVLPGNEPGAWEPHWWYRSRNQSRFRSRRRSHLRQSGKLLDARRMRPRPSARCNERGVM